VSDRGRPTLILVLGDQLTPGRGALKGAVPGRDSVVMAEVPAEACYVKHNRHKIAFIFAAMRHFCEALRAQGFTVHYFPYSDEGPVDLLAAVTTALQLGDAEEVRCCEPGEHRLLEEIRRWQLPVTLSLTTDDRFLCSHTAFADWAAGRKQLRMEYFYRDMRRQYGVLLDVSGEPEGGKWNYDAENRKGWRSQVDVPDRPVVIPDEITSQVIELVNREFPDHPGDLQHFYLAVTRRDAEAQLLWFLRNGLPSFGTYQDALAEESPWMFHSLISMYLNIGLLEPLQVCERVEQAWRKGDCELSAAEGFIRQVLGWREYVRGIYWLSMPEYAQGNALDASRPLPEWFWTGDTDMRCLEVALKQTLELGYAHHIRTLLVLAFVLLAVFPVANLVGTESGDELAAQWEDSQPLEERRMNHPYLGSPMEVFQENAFAIPPKIWSKLDGPESSLVIFSMFLLGLCIGRSRILHDAAHHLPLIRRVFAWGVGIGIVSAIAEWSLTQKYGYAVFTQSTASKGLQFFGDLLFAYGSTSLALAYGAGFVLLAQRPGWQTALQPLQNLGKMALTAYLSSTLMFTTLFYGWGFGQLFLLGPAATTFYAVLFFVTLLLFCTWWLDRFRFGPAEWLWRSLTYLKLQPLRR